MMSSNKIFIDFDGVVCDTNTLKERNISEAYKYVFGNYNKDFVEFFTKNNGIPRELKLNSYFNSDAIENKILKKYSILNQSLINAELSAGFEEYLRINDNSDLYILSGGDKNEISMFLKKNNIFHCFSEILTGPKTKSTNLSRFAITNRDLFIGDSRHDYIVAKEFNLNFVFMTGLSQESPPFEFLDNSVVIVKDFKDLININKPKKNA